MSSLDLTRRRILPVEEVKKPVEPTKEEILETFVKNLMSQIENPELTARLKRLHLIATRPLSLLSPEQCGDLDTVRKLSHSAYGTEAYDALHSLVSRLFTMTTVYAPHTVGSFFTGCMVPSNLSEATEGVNPGCSLLCSDAMPPPGKDWGFCSQNVLWCVLSSSAIARNMRKALQNSPGSSRLRMDYNDTTLPETFDFIHVTYIPSSSKAILFVDYKTYDEFPGFTLREKARLIHRMRITDVKLLSYDQEPDSVKYKDLVGSVSKVHTIKSRADVRDSETPAQRAERRARVAKRTARPSTAEPGPLTWQTAVGLAFCLMLLVLLGVVAAIAISYMRRPTPSKKRGRK